MNLTLFDIFSDQATPKEAQASNVINKLLAVKTVNDKRVSREDLAYCERIHKNYEEVLKNLDLWEIAFKTDLTTNWEGQYREEKLYRGTTYSEKRGYNGSDELMGIRFFPGEGLNEIEKKRKQLATSYPERILKYFNDTYNLALKFDTKDADQYKDYKQVIDYIFTKVKFSSLADQGARNIVEEFKKIVWYQEKYKHEKDKIHFMDMWVTRYCYGHSRQAFPYRNDNNTFETLLKTLKYFDTGSTEGGEMGEIKYQDPTNYAKAYDLGGNKIRSAKFYKNHKITIQFSDSKTAQDFVNKFELSTLPLKY